jgi:6-phosphogluconate dehydrogenase
MTTLANIGVVGLAVMGSNLARNLVRHGHRVALFNRSPERTSALVADHGSEGDFVASESLEDFVASLERPRRVVVMVKAGAGTDAVIDQLVPLLEEGDIVVDGGNAHFEDTRRREAGLREHGLHFVGTGISGGEVGALEGPSIMPGGSKESYAALGPILESIAAQVDGEACCAWMGPDGAGHFVKMVHNGIEYADMQFIAEAYDVLSAAGDSAAREAARGTLGGPDRSVSVDDRRQLVDDVRDALWSSKVVAYAQGLEQIRRASEEYGWDVDIATVARIWRGGCIIRARLLAQISDAYAAGGLRTLLVAPSIAEGLGDRQDAWRRVVGLATTAGVPVPGFSSALGYYDTVRAERLPAALVQGLRDNFGAHTYGRIDRPGAFHTLWSGDRSELEA